MEEEKRTLGFAFIIESTMTSEGERLGVRTIHSGVPNEVILTFMNNWLKNEESKYHEFFKKEYL